MPEKRKPFKLGTALKLQIQRDVARWRISAARHGHRITWQEIWLRVIETYFASHYEISNGVRRAVLPPAEVCPTLRQIRALFAKWESGWMGGTVPVPAPNESRFSFFARCMTRLQYAPNFVSLSAGERSLCEEQLGLGKSKSIDGLAKGPCLKGE